MVVGTGRDLSVVAVFAAALFAAALFCYMHVAALMAGPSICGDL